MEPVAQIDPVMAAKITEERWASYIELHAGEVLATPLVRENGDNGRICILTFSRHPSELEVAILDSSSARRARSLDVDLKPPWANGAKILCSGLGPEDFDHELCTYQIVILETDLMDLWNDLEQLPYTMRKLKPGCGLALLPETLSLLGISFSGASGSNQSSHSLPSESTELFQSSVLVASSPSFSSHDVPTCVHEVCIIDVKFTFVNVSVSSALDEVVTAKTW